MGACSSSLTNGQQGTSNGGLGAGQYCGSSPGVIQFYGACSISYASATSSTGGSGQFCNIYSVTASGATLFVSGSTTTPPPPPTPPSRQTTRMLIHDVKQDIPGLIHSAVISEINNPGVGGSIETGVTVGNEAVTIEVTAQPGHFTPHQTRELIQDVEQDIPRMIHSAVISEINGNGGSITTGVTVGNEAVTIEVTAEPATSPNP